MSLLRSTLTSLALRPADAKPYLGEEAAAMQLLAKRFMYLLMDERAALAARLVAAGAPFWAGDGGSMVVAARSAVLLTLSKRESGQVASLLGAKPTGDVQRLGRSAIPAKLLSFLLADAEVDATADEHSEEPGGRRSVERMA